MKNIPNTNNLYYASIDGDIYKGEKKKYLLVLIEQIMVIFNVLYI